jgi:hypothetical protein
MLTTAVELNLGLGPLTRGDRVARKLYPGAATRSLVLYERERLVGVVA